ncbi:MAG: hypothetical protein ACQEP3_02485 [Patescibacteria group bacterium]
MRWKDRDFYSAPLLDRCQQEIPTSFYRSFAIVFGSIRKPKKALLYLEKINSLMDQKRGGGRLQKAEIYDVRNEHNNLAAPVIYDDHHVRPTSRDPRPDYCKNDQEVQLPKVFHASWHIMFLNLFGNEVIIFLQRFFRTLEKGEKIDFYKINDYVEDSKGKGGKLSRV